MIGQFKPSSSRDWVTLTLSATFKPELVGGWSPFLFPFHPSTTIPSLPFLHSCLKDAIVQVRKCKQAVWTLYNMKSETDDHGNEKRLNRKEHYTRSSFERRFVSWRFDRSVDGVARYLVISIPICNLTYKKSVDSGWFVSYSMQYFSTCWLLTDSLTLLKNNL